MNSKKLSLSHDVHEDGKKFDDLLQEFYNDPSTKYLNYLIIGSWGDCFETSPESIIKNLVANKHKLPNLEGIYVGDMDSEECEISWIIQCDLSPLLQAFPDLKELRVKGSSGLRLSNLKHNKLETLIIECGGLGKDVLHDIETSNLSNLKRLLLYLGVEDYGFDASIEDLRPFMKSGLFPNLRYLGLVDSEIQDEIAIEIAQASVLDQIEILDLSLGTLTDKGAEALLNSDKIKKLKFLDLNYHYMSDEMLEKITCMGVNIDVSNQQKTKEYDDELFRYPAVTV
ncbi:MAG: STM4015 family protein [Bacillota bacterium]|nr:STM4015 family protein [Bacillota bacterium]